MQILDRIALTVRPKRRYVEWANRLEPKHELTLEQARSQSYTYLVSPDEDEDGQIDLQAVIDQWADEIFEDQLGAWTTDEEQWPRNRSTHVFRDWFDVELTELVTDLDDEVPLVEELPEFPADKAMVRCAWCLREFGDDLEPTPATVQVATTAPFDVPEDTAVPWPVPTSEGFALATGPDEEQPEIDGRLPLTFWVCSEACAEALREGLARQEAEETDAT